MQGKRLLKEKSTHSLSYSHSKLQYDLKSLAKVLSPQNLKRMDIRYLEEIKELDNVQTSLELLVCSLSENFSLKASQVKQLINYRFQDSFQMIINIQIQNYFIVYQKIISIVIYIYFINQINIPMEFQHVLIISENIYKDKKILLNNVKQFLYMNIMDQRVIKYYIHIHIVN